MIRTQQRRRRPALMLIGAALVLLPATAVQAQEGAGSGLGSFDISATAPGFALRVEDGGYCAAPPTAGCEGVVPEAVARLQNGPVSYALSSIAWPGTLAGNLGSLLIVAGGSQVPQQATQLNDPVRAEARTGEYASNTTVPGATMTVKAGTDEVTALAETPKTEAPGVGTFGSISGTSRTALTGPSTAIASAGSRITNISLAGGQLRIASLTSTADVTTDGRVATGKGSTTASGVTVGGVPVTIDDQGITVAGQNQGVNAVAQATVNQVVSALGITVALGKPTGTPKDGALDYSAGSLTVSWTPQAGTRFTVMLGGATATVAAAPGFPLGSDQLPVGTTAAAAGATSATPATPSGLGTAASAPSFGNPPDLSGTPLTAPTVAAPRTAVPGTIAARRTATSLPLPGGNSAVLVMLGLAGVGLIAAGMRRLPDLVLAPPSARCPLLEES